MDALETRAMVDHEERHWWYRGRRRIVQGELDRLRLPAGVRVLDAGCGSGRLLDVLSGYGDVSGIDMREENVELARGRGHADVHMGVVEDLPWPDETFDLVTCLDVLEHTTDDRAALRELRRATRPGGHFVLTVPTYQALWSNHDILNHHYRRYRRGMLLSAAADTGWFVDRTTFFNSILFAPAVSVRLLQRLRRERPGDHRSDVEITPPWLYPALELPLNAEAWWLRRGHRLPVGLSLLGVLRRW